MIHNTGNPLDQSGNGIPERCEGCVNETTFCEAREAKIAKLDSIINEFELFTEEDYEKV